MPTRRAHSIAVPEWVGGHHDCARLAARGLPDAFNTSRDARPRRPDLSAAVRPPPFRVRFAFLGSRPFWRRSGCSIAQQAQVAADSEALAVILLTDGDVSLSGWPASPLAIPFLLGNHTAWCAGAVSPFARRPSHAQRARQH